MNAAVSFILDGSVVTLDFGRSDTLHPTTSVLNYLRTLPGHKGVKEGCAEGDCGACTVVLGELGADNRIHYKDVDSCLVFLPMLHGKQLVTVENLMSQAGALHPVQVAMVESNGSQCGFCTPGFVMSLFSLYKNSDQPTREEIDDALTGNLCRCTGYKPIVEAAAHACVRHGNDHFSHDEPRIAELLRSIPQRSLSIKTDRQQYSQPRTLQEALVLKHQLPEAIVLCGATDVALRVTKKHELLKEVIDLSAVEELKRVYEDTTSLTIGAGVPLSDVMDVVNPWFPALYDMLVVFGSQQIRNLATLGGNLGTASPIGDALPVLIAYNARIALESVEGKRETSLDGFFTGYRQTLRRPNELITAVIIPKMLDGALVKSYKISKRKDLDISTVSAGFRLELNDGLKVRSVKLVYGGMAERTKGAATVEQFLEGKIWERSAIEDAMPLLDRDFTPISDVRGSAEFRRVVAKNLLLKFWSETTPKTN